MKDDYHYTTADEQIKKLKNQKLTFENEKNAKKILDTYGYYNIINGYREPYITRIYDDKFYDPGITFEQIFSLFSFDHKIRNAILLAMIDFEEHLKAVVANIVAESFGINHTEYLDRNNYRDRFVRNPKFRRNKILDDMTKTANSSTKQPIKYYREHYNIIPPWILFKGISFGTMVNYVRFFKSEQREKILEQLYGSKVTPENIDQFKDLLSDTLFLCYEYRNLAAHGGRVYNYTPQHTIRPFDESTPTKPGLPQLLYALSYLEFYPPIKRLDKSTSNALTEYCQKYENDIDRLEKATGLEITVSHKVWINRKSNIFHSTPYCSGSKNLKVVDYEDIKNLDFRKCKRCCKDYK